MSLINGYNKHGFPHIFAGKCLAQSSVPPINPLFERVLCQFLTTFYSVVYRNRKSKLLKHCVTAFRTDIDYHNNVFVVQGWAGGRTQARWVFHIVDTLPLLTTISFKFDSLRCNHLFNNSLIPVLTPLSQAVVQKTTEHSLKKERKVLL